MCGSHLGQSEHPERTSADKLLRLCIMSLYYVFKYYHVESRRWHEWLILEVLYNHNEDGRCGGRIHFTRTTRRNHRAYGQQGSWEYRPGLLRLRSFSCTAGVREWNLDFHHWVNYQAGGRVYPCLWSRDDAGSIRLIWFVATFQVVVAAALQDDDLLEGWTLLR